MNHFPTDHLSRHSQVIQVLVQPSLATVEEVLAASADFSKPPNLVPLCASISAEFLTPSSIYLKIAAKSKSNLSFLFESAATTETIGRYSFVGAGTRPETPGTIGD